jgi:tRNA 2-thiouridine synthesizing protein B
MLHIVNKSPFEHSALDSCLRLAKKGSAILLIEDGVLAAQKGTSLNAKVAAATETFEVFALGPDLKARGLDEGRLVAGIRVIDYGGFVDLVVERGTTQSWL